MKKIGFIGAYDKTDLIMYVAKILVSMGKKVMVIDTTVNQKAKYIIPTINPSVSYVTSFEGIDVAVGLYSYQELENYLGIDNFQNSEYDYTLIDFDESDVFEAFKIYENDKNFFVTSFDLFSLKRGIEILTGLRLPIQLYKVLFSTEMKKEDDDYLNYLSLGARLEWKEERIYFPFDNGDEINIIDNQRIEKLKFRNLGNNYKVALMYLIEYITDESEGSIKRTLRQLEKEG